MKRFSYFLILVLYISPIHGQSKITPEDMTVLDQPGDKMMQAYLTGLIDKQFAIRDSLLSTLKTAGEWDRRSKIVRDSIISWTGPLPERTPLNVRISGTIDHEDYTVEKIIFESRPDFLVSANLYLPKKYTGQRPALLNVIGHTPLGKSDERYQRLSISQAKKGFVVLTIDQLGQGERKVKEYASWESVPGNTHQIIGIKSFISGTHVFNIMVWDAIRSIDYLTSRPEVDPENICITGSSGGGMMATYILPFEDRIKVSLPTCNPNTWSYRVKEDLGTDHEQVFFGAFKGGIDPRGDPLFTHVPRPLFLNTTTDDHLNPPRGVWNLHTWLYKSYAAHGAPEKLGISMVSAGHAYNKEQREISSSWMLKWTGNDPSAFHEEDVVIEKNEDLWVSDRGNVYHEPDSRQPEDLVMDFYQENKAEWEPLESSSQLESFQTRMKGLIENVLALDLDQASTSYRVANTRQKGDINMRSFVLEPEEGIDLPLVLLSPDANKANKEVILYLHENGKAALLDDINIVSDLISRGYSICAVDLRGTGETSPDMAEKFWDFLAGKPIFGQRVEDVLKTTDWLKRIDPDIKAITLWGTGMAALYGAFAGVISEEISAFILEEPLISFENVVQVKIPQYNHEILLPGILEHFAMTQIYQALCPAKVMVINPLKADKSMAAAAEFSIINKDVRLAYKLSDVEKNLSITKVDNSERGDLIINRITGR